MPARPASRRAMAATIRARRSPCLRHRTSGAAETPQALRRSEKSLRDNPHPDFSNCSHTTPVSTTLVRSFHLRWKQVPDPTHHSRKWAFSLLDTGFRHGPRGPTHESNHKADRFANVRVFATWTLFESEFWPNRFKRLGIRPIQSENFSLEDGEKMKMLKRHLRTAHNLSPDEYRKRWNLPGDYPMVASNYAKTRSKLAKAIGLGRARRRKRTQALATSRSTRSKRSGRK